jgi:hypothetical protein
VQVDPIKPKSKAPVSKSLKLKCDELLSNVAFKFNLRRYTEGAARALLALACERRPKAGAYTRSRLSST